MFLKTRIDGITIDGRTYPAGSVAAAHKDRREDLIRRGHAEDHPGPADEVPSPDRQPAPETSIPKAQPERAVSRR